MCYTTKGFNLPLICLKFYKRASLTILQYTLPKLPHPLPKKRKTTSVTTSPSTITITLKSSRNPPLNITLSSQSPFTSILDLKASVSEQASIPIEKIKVLYNKKPAGDTKTVAELLGDKAQATTEVELGLMILGGAASVTPRASPAPSPTAASTASGSAPASEKATAQAASQFKPVVEDKSAQSPRTSVGPSGKEVLATEEFWSDLKGFLTQRLKDEAEGERVLGVFRKAHEGQK
jgi:hypothetical protein